MTSGKISNGEKQVAIDSRTCGFLNRIWNSPTFTTWGNQLSQSLRLFLVTPLVLSRFNQTEIAAWYLFASLNFFGTTVSQRLSLTFSRMFAFAMGGAEKLISIKGVQPNRENASPNWQAFERAYGTLGSIQSWMGWLNVLIAVGMGWFGLNNLLQGYNAPGAIWMAFAIMQLTSLLTFIYQRYSVALIGMNYVAMNARWGTITSIVSVCVGALTLMLGGGIVALTVVMQAAALLGVLRVRLILKHVEGGRVLRFRSRQFDLEVFRWAWPPIWKGFIAQLGNLGAVQFTSVLYTAFGNKSEIASFLFASRMMQIIVQFGTVPFASMAPKFSRLLAAGDREGFRKLFYQRSIAAMVLLTVGIVSAAVVLPLLPTLIGANVDFVPIHAWFIYGLFTLFISFNVFNASTITSGNEMIYYWETALAACISIGLLAVFKNILGVYTPILCMTLPMAIILNVGPLKKAAEFFDEPIMTPLMIAFLKLVVIFCLAWAVLAQLKL